MTALDAGVGTVLKSLERWKFYFTQTAVDCMWFQADVFVVSVFVWKVLEDNVFFFRYLVVLDMALLLRSRFLSRQILQLT